jgi:DNA-binding XRE family transcriptional regulator
VTVRHPEAQTAVLGLDPRLDLTEWCEIARLWFGWSARDVLGRSSLEVIPAETGDRTMRLRALYGWAGGVREICVVRGRDELVTVEATVTKVWDTDGLELGFTSVMRRLNSSQIARLQSHAVRHVPRDGTGISVPLDGQFHAVEAMAPANYSKVIGANIRARRRAAGLNQGELADALEAVGVKVSRTRINDYEAGRHKPEIDKLAAIAQVTNTPTVGWFLDPHEFPPEEADE